MDAGTASIGAAIISAVASIAVAWITTRSRIERPSPTPLTAAPNLRDSSSFFRGFGWTLTVCLYAGSFCFALLGGLGLGITIRNGDLTNLPPVTVFFVCAGFLSFVATWALKRLKRR